MNIQPEAYGHASEERVDDFYHTFFEVEVPAGTSASRAWFGRIRPFENDNDARILLRYLDRDRAVDAIQGTLVVPDICALEPHALEPALVKASITFNVVLLEYKPPRHPEVYSVSPYVDALAYPGHPHLRLDLVLQYRGRALPSLCVYSPAEFQYSGLIPRAVELLDQATIYLAKHVVWLRTRRLYDTVTGKLVFAPKLGELVIDTEERDPMYIFGISKEHRGSQRIWRGYWPGKVAAMGPYEHSRTIDPKHECWCGSGEHYGLCHRPREVAFLKKHRLAGIRGSF